MDASIGPGGARQAELEKQFRDFWTGDLKAVWFVGQRRSDAKAQASYDDSNHQPLPCQRTTRTKEKDLDGIEYRLYNRYTAITVRITGRI